MSRYKIGKFYEIRTTPSSSNCKLEYVDNIAYVQNQKKDFDEALKKMRSLVYLHTNRAEVKDFILKNYEVYHCTKVPAGYYNGFQYHILLRNTLSAMNAESRRKPLKEDEKKVNKLQIELKFKKIFKDKRRKNDIVGELIRAIEN